MKTKFNHKSDHVLKIKPIDPVHTIMEYDLDLLSNHIYLFGVETYGPNKDTEEPGVEYIMANRFIRNINLCMRVNPKKPLLILMKSCGGYWDEGIAIFDAIKAYPWPVTMLNYSQASSMTSIIFQAANKSIMMPNSHFMFHDGTTGIEGTPKQVRSLVKFEKRVVDKTMLDIYANSMKGKGKYHIKSLQYIRKWLRARMDKEEDVYLTARETCDLGLADEIFDGNWKKLTTYTAEQLQRKGR